MKEQLKIIAGVEFIDVNLGYVDAENPADARIVFVAEQADETLMLEAPLQPGHVFAIGRSIDDERAVYKLENKAVAESSRFENEGVRSNRAARECIEAAWSCFENNGDHVAAGMHMRKKDYLLFVNDIQAKGPSDEISLAEFAGLCSAACNRPAMASLAIPGIVRISGSMDDLKELEDILRVAKNAGTKRILLPFSTIRNMQDIPMELVSSMSPDFYQDGDIVGTTRKALGI